MKEFENKNILKDLFYSKFMILIVLIFIYILAKGSYGIWKKYRVANLREKEAIEQLAELQEDKNRLESEINFLNSEVGTESVLRTDYSLIKPEEKLIIIIDEDEIVEEIEDHSFLEKTMSWFRFKNLLN